LKEKILDKAQDKLEMEKEEAQNKLELKKKEEAQNKEH